jgi:hypothetical protein
MKRAACVLVLALTQEAAAHPLEMGNLRLDVRDGAIDLSLELDVTAVAALLDLDASRVDADTVRARTEALASSTYRLAAIDDCTWRSVTAELHARTVTLTDRATCSSEPRELRWPLPFVTRVSPTFQLLVDAHAFDNERVVIIDKQTPMLVLAREAETVSLAGFVLKGVEHIGATPSQWQGPNGLKLPDGIDHVLFLLGLLLAGGSIMRLLGIVSGFTVGHTITLGLAALGVVRPPSSVIEPLIALTIAFVAVEAYTSRLERHRWKIATCFGLIHGFGFANALTELHLSRGDMAKALFGYNLGVELGQVVLVLLIGPLVWLVHRDARVGRPLTRALSIGIFLVAIYWFFIRL